MSYYTHRLERDLARWQSAGFLSEASAQAILSDARARASPIGAAAIFALLGAVLFAFAVMSFVAAHWTGMPKLARLALLIGLLWACYGAAGAFMSRQASAFAQAALIAGIGVYGASIMLIAQMYHMQGNPADAVLAWALGGLLAAVLAKSRPALAATILLISLWSGMERGASAVPHWGFLPVWAATAGTAAALRWRPGLHLAALSLLLWA